MKRKDEVGDNGPFSMETAQLMRIRDIQSKFAPLLRDSLTVPAFEAWWKDEIRLATDFNVSLLCPKHKRLKQVQVEVTMTVYNAIKERIAPDADALWAFFRMSGTQKVQLLQAIFEAATSPAEREAIAAGEAVDYEALECSGCDALYQETVAQERRMNPGVDLDAQKALMKSKLFAEFDSLPIFAGRDHS